MLTQTRMAELDAKFGSMSNRQKNKYFVMHFEEFEALCAKRERNGYLSAEERARGQELYEEESWGSRVPGQYDEEPSSPLLDWWDHLVMNETHFGKGARTSSGYLDDAKPSRVEKPVMSRKTFAGDEPAKASKSVKFFEPDDEPGPPNPADFLPVQIKQEQNNNEL